jgi:hypothetical protein
MAHSEALGQKTGRNATARGLRNDAVGLPAGSTRIPTLAKRFPKYLAKRTSSGNRQDRRFDPERTIRPMRRPKMSMPMLLSHGHSSQAIGELLTRLRAPK